MLSYAALPPPAADFAIVGARIEVGDGTVIANGTIVVQGGRITAVASDVAVPGGLSVVKGDGLTVYPGFIDAYCTKGLKLPDPPAAGEAPDTRNTAPATLWHGFRRGVRSDVQAAKYLDLGSELDARRQQGITSLHITSGTGMFGGTSALVDLTEKGEVTKPRVANEIAFRNTGGGGGAGGGGGYPGTLFGITAMVRQILADAETASRNPDSTKDAVYTELGSLFRKETPALFNVNTAREILRADRIAEEFAITMVVNGGSEGFRITDLLKSRKTPVILGVGLSNAPSTKATDDGPPEEVLKDRYDAWKERSENAKKLAEAGIPIAFGNLSGFDSYLEGVRKHIAAGLPRQEALKALSLNPATIFGVEKDLGTVATGKVANLTILSGDFADAKSAVVAVYVHGVRYEAKKESK